MIYQTKFASWYMMSKNVMFHEASAEFDWNLLLMPLFSIAIYTFYDFIFKFFL